MAFSGTAYASNSCTYYTGSVYQLSHVVHDVTDKTSNHDKNHKPQ